MDDRPTPSKGSTPLDPYHAAYLFRRALEDQPESVPVDLEAAHGMFEALSEDDALRLVDVLGERLEHPNLATLAMGLSRMDSRPRLRERWIRALGQHPVGGVRRAILESLKKDPSPRVQAACLSAWRSFADEIPLDFLRPYLKHSDARVRANAVELLVERDQSVDTRVLEILSNDPSPRVAAQACLGLWRRGSFRLLREYDEEESPEARLAFLHALGKAGKDKRIEALIRNRFEEGSLRERRLAARSLARVAPASRVPEWMDLALRSPDHEMRVDLARGCLEEDSQATRRALLDAVSMDRQGLRLREHYVANALSVLKSLGCSIDVESISPMLEAEDPRVRANAIELLEDRTEIRSLRSPLERCFEEETPRVHSNAAVALWKRGSTRAVARLVDEVESGQPEIRPSAAFGLGRIGGTVAEMTLQRALREGDPATRRIAYRFLAKAA